MLIRYQDGRSIDYGVFALKAPYYSVDAVESSVRKTELSGINPTIMSVVLDNGTVFHTKKFVGLDSNNSEFRIVDREVYAIIGKMLDSIGHYGEIIDLLLIHYGGESSEWAITVYHDDVLDLCDGTDFFDVNTVTWLSEK